MALPTRTNGGSARIQEQAPERFYNADLARFDPFADLSSVRNTMNTLLDSVMRPAPGSHGARIWAPTIDVYEKDGAYVVECAIPGVKKDDIDIEVVDNRLTVSGRFEELKNENESKYLYREVRRGSFSRTIAFPDAIDADKVTAAYDNGILKLTVPLVKTVQSKKVSIKG